MHVQSLCQPVFNCSILVLMFHISCTSSLLFPYSTWRLERVEVVLEDVILLDMLLLAEAE